MLGAESGRDPLDSRSESINALNFHARLDIPAINPWEPTWGRPLTPCFQRLEQSLVLTERD
jgi:hypothetical protein